MTGRILGIDPGGTSGAWALIDDRGGSLAADDFLVAGVGAQRVISAPLFAATVERFAPMQAVIERVGARPGQGVSSMFKFGRGLGIVEGVVAAAMVPVMYVAPAVWKRHFGLASEKEASRQRAIEIWPESASLFSRKRDHGRAEAALIARWGLSARTVSGGAS